MREQPPTADNRCSG